ncbi:MAG TPA: VOC family protein [Actinomycetes bacterium]|jgi:predicted enzyme related to lactoylglutathione lyase|nr:VOC family protein [Actinomycetes bacterium]
MDMKIEVVFLGVSDVDRAKSFYVDQVGFHADHDQTVREGLRFVQLTPPGSACSVSFGEGITAMEAGAQKGVMMVVEDVAATRAHLVANGVEVTEVEEMPWGLFAFFADPDGNAWTLQQLPAWAGR